MKKLISILIVLFTSTFVFAQSADVISEILKSEQATIGQVSYLCAVQQLKILESDDYEKAVEAMISEGYLPENVSSSDLVTLSQAAFLFSKNWDISGGLMYMITKGSKRYVFKQFVADGVISVYADPSSKLSGSELLALYSSALGRYGDFNMKSVSMEAE